VVSDVAKRSMPELREAIRAENRCGAASMVRLNTAWQSASRQ